MKILITNIHSLKNAGDAALLWATIQQLRENFPGCQITLAINLPATFEQYLQEMRRFEGVDPQIDDLQVVGSFMFWARKRDRSGIAGWSLPAILRLALTSLWLVVSRRLSAHSSTSSSEKPLDRGRELLQAYLDCDLVVSVAGNFLYHSGRLGLPLWINLYSMAYGPLLSKPLYLFPQSIGPLRRRSEVWLTKRVLSAARIVMLRETESLQFLQKHGFEHHRLELVPDVAIDFQGFSGEVGRQWLETSGLPADEIRPKLGVTAINWAPQSPDFTPEQQLEYEFALAAACREFILKRQGVVFLFTQVTGEAEIARDEIPAGRIYEQLREYSSQVHLITQGAIPHLLKAAYSQMDIFIGTRMHSNIFALSSGVPVVAIAYRYKTVGLMKSLELAHWLIEIDRLGVQQGRESLLELVRELWQQAPGLRPVIRQRIEKLAGECRRAGILVADDYARLSREY